MPDQPPSERFKTDAPHLPGVSARAVHSQPSLKPVRLIGFLAALVFSLVIVRWVFPRHPRLPLLHRLRRSKFPHRPQTPTRLYLMRPSRNRLSPAWRRWSPPGLPRTLST